MELLARNHYAQADGRNPVKCSLFYLALRKKNILAGLWRTALGNKEQAAMTRFLANDFNDTRWRTAASKNAYALLAKQRYGKPSNLNLIQNTLQHFSCWPTVSRTLSTSAFAISMIFN
jgi:rabconnectin-3a